MVCSCLETYTKRVWLAYLNPAAALDWYKKSAARGNVAAQKRVSELQSEKLIKKSGN